MAPLTTGVIQAILREFSQQRAGRGRYGGGGSGITATGGVISDYNDPGPGLVYRAHVFTSTGTFDVSALGSFGSNVEYLVVAGGGGGGGMNNSAGGGGGAGGFRTNVPSHPLSTNNPSFSVSAPTSYTVTVGAGGAGGAGSSPFLASNGIDSYFGPPSTPAGILSKGGGGGNGGPGTAGSPGGSGGGGGAFQGPGGFGYNPSTPAPVLSPIPLSSPYPITQGNNAGASNQGGGGGGAGGVGGSADAPGGNVGGPGTSFSITGITTHYAAGGTGGNTNISTNGIGGRGEALDQNNHTAGVYATGSGGGGAYNNNPNAGKNGGSGIVVVRYQIASLTAVQKATGGLISFFGGKTIHTFTSSGTFANPTALTVDYLIVGAGGGGGYNLAGGGGGGLVHYKTGVYLPASPYPVSVGAGGAGDATPGATATTGGSSIFNSVTASGGGGGGSRPSSAGASGGSGGGASIDGAQSASTGTGDPSPSPGTANQVSPANGWGNDGGGQTSSGGAAKGGGGGGAGGVGQTGTAPPYAPGTVGLGGPGLEYTFTGSPVFYGGGGGGGSTGGPSNTAQNNQYGGFGFPNNAGSPTPYPGTSGGNGYEHLGGGGGGGPNEPPYGGGSGGSGIVIIAYPS